MFFKLVLLNQSIVTEILAPWNLAKEGLSALVTSWGSVIVWGVRVQKNVKSNDNPKNLKRKKSNTKKFH